MNMLRFPSEFEILIVVTESCIHMRTGRNETILVSSACIVQCKSTNNGGEDKNRDEILHDIRFLFAARRTDIRLYIAGFCLSHLEFDRVTLAHDFESPHQALNANVAFVPSVVEALLVGRREFADIADAGRIGP